MEIVLLESLGISDVLLGNYAAKLEAQGHTFRAYERSTDLEAMKEKCQNADVVMIANMPFPDEVIRSCPKLKFIDVAFTGVDHVGLAAARERGIAVSNASGYSNESVAELVLGMMLSLLRNVPEVEKRCRDGQTKEGLVGCELAGKKVGVVGTGAIGRRVAALCRAFGCEVLGFNPRMHGDEPDDIRYLDLDGLLQEADLVTLHCPLKEDTKGLISRERIAKMKEGAILINASRGPVVDSEALAEALRSGKLGGAGIDVFEMEPPVPEDHPLLHTPNTIVTPHVAFATRESMILRAQIVFDSLEKWMKGEQVNKVL